MDYAWSRRTRAPCLIHVKELGQIHEGTDSALEKLRAVDMKSTMLGSATALHSHKLPQAIVEC